MWRIEKNYADTANVSEKVQLIEDSGKNLWTFMTIETEELMYSRDEGKLVL